MSKWEEALMNPFNITLGSDPEVWVKDRKKNMIVSCHDLLPGTKEAPFKVKDGAVQVDGLAAEFNIDPVNNVQDWTDKHNSVMEQMRDMLGPSYELVIEPVAFFDPEYFKHLPPETQQLGCDPDFNAWTGKQNPAPNAHQVDPSGGVMRTASGHVHFGFTEGASIEDRDHRKRVFEIIKHLDASIGVRTLAWDKDPRRRALYGRAGACRIKPYGGEYRVPSNKWLRFPLASKAVFRFVLQGVENYLIGQRLKEETKQDILKRLA